MTYLEVKKELLKRGFQKIGARFVKEVDIRYLGINEGGDDTVTVDVHMVGSKFRIVINYMGVRMWNDVQEFARDVDIDFMLIHISNELGEYINNKSLGDIVGSILTKRNDGN